MDCMQNASLPCTSLFPEVCSGSCPLSQWCPQVLSSSPPAFNLFPAPALFSNELALHIRWPKNWSFSFSSGFSHEYSRFISLRIDWFDLLAVLGTLKTLLQYHNLKASVLQVSVFFMVQLSHCTWLLKKMNSEFLSHAIFHGSWVRMYSSKRVLN